MRKLSEYEGEEAIELLADILEPCVQILGDPEIKKVMGEEKSKVKGISYALKHYQKEVIQVMAALEGVPVEKYTCNLLTLPMAVLQILNDKDLIDFFVSQGQTMDPVSSTSVAENTKDLKK